MLHYKVKCDIMKLIHEPQLARILQHKQHTQRTKPATFEMGEKVKCWDEKNQYEGPFTIVGWSGEKEATRKYLIR